MSTPTPRPSTAGAAGTGPGGEWVPAPGHPETRASGAGADIPAGAPADPGADAPPGAGAPPAVVPPPARPRWQRQVLVALAALAVVAVVGVPLGLLWSAIAPHLPVRMSADGPMLTSPEPEQFIADEGWYAILTAGYGALAAALGWAVLRRYRGPVTLVGLVLGAAAGGIVAWKLGSSLGHAHYEYLKAHAAVGTVFGKPVALRVGSVGLPGGLGPRIPGDTLIGALTATAVYLLFTGFSVDPQLRPYREIAGREARPGFGDPAGRSWSAPDGTAWSAEDPVGPAEDWTAHQAAADQRPDARPDGEPGGERDARPGGQPDRP